MDYIEKLQPGIVDGVGAIMITEKESTIPHFSVVREDGSEVQIMIQDNKYLSEATLSPDECKRLNDWMNSKNSDSLLPNMWLAVVLCWNGLYTDNRIGKNDRGLIPDYSAIKPFSK